MSQITEAVLALNLSAADMAKAQGVAAVPELTQLLKHEDNAVRTIAVIALGEIQHPEAFKALMYAAQEEDNSVAGTAVTQLSKHGSLIGTNQLLQLLGTMKSEAARSQLVLTIGRLGGDPDRGGLQSFCAQHDDQEEALSCMAALAKLGLDKSRKDFSVHFMEKRDLKAFSMAEYIDQPWLLPYLGHLLRYMDPVETLGDPPPGFPSMLRVCDKAVVLIAKISGKQFSFPTDRHMNYSIMQISEAERVAGSLP